MRTFIKNSFYVFFLLISFGSLAQKNSAKNNPVQTKITVCDSTNWAKEGTYDIIPLTKMHEVFTTEILCLIESNRKEFESVDLHISPLTIIRIYPKKKIQNTSNK